MKRKGVLFFVLFCALAVALPSQATQIPPPKTKVQRPQVQPPKNNVQLLKITPIKFDITVQFTLQGYYSYTVILSRLGQPVTGAKVMCGPLLLVEPKSMPGWYTGSSNLPVNLGQSVVFTVLEKSGTHCSASASVHNTVKCIKPLGGQLFDRSKFSHILVQWTFATGGAPVYILARGMGTNYSTSQNNVTGGQFNFPLAGVPAGATGVSFVVFLTLNDFTYSGSVAAGSRGVLQQHDSTWVTFK